LNAEDGEQEEDEDEIEEIESDDDIVVHEKIVQQNELNLHK